MRNDIWPAQETGLKTALFAGDRLSLRRREDDPDCRKTKPDLEITHLEQLLHCL
jgi:putative hydrolase of the HAD superfamily